MTGGDAGVDAAPAEEGGEEPGPEEPGDEAPEDGRTTAAPGQAPGLALPPRLPAAVQTPEGT